MKKFITTTSICFMFLNTSVFARDLDNYISKNYDSSSFFNNNAYASIINNRFKNSLIKIASLDKLQICERLVKEFWGTKYKGHNTTEFGMLSGSANYFIARLGKTKFIQYGVLLASIVKYNMCKLFCEKLYTYADKYEAISPNDTVAAFSVNFCNMIVNNVISEEINRLNIVPFKNVDIMITLINKIVALYYNLGVVANEFFIEGKGIVLGDKKIPTSNKVKINIPNDKLVSMVKTILGRCLGKNKNTQYTIDQLAEYEQNKGYEHQVKTLTDYSNFLFATAKSLSAKR